MIHAISQGALLGLLLSVLIGPVFFMLIKTAMNDGLREAYFLEAGIITSDISCIVLSYLGMVRILEDPENRKIATLAGGILLMVYGIMTFFSRKKNGMTVVQEKKKKGTSLFLKGYFFNITNPSVIFFWVGTVGLTLSEFQGSSTLTFVHFASTIAVVFLFDLLKIYLAEKISRRATEKTLSLITVAAGVGILLFGLVLLAGYFDLI